MTKTALEFAVSSASPTPLTTNKHLVRWVEKMAELCQPDAVHWIDGSEQEYERLPTTLPGSRTAPSSAPSPRTAPAPPTTGKIPSSCGASSSSSFAAPCA